jgi:hypothetical protein
MKITDVTLTLFAWNDIPLLVGTAEVLVDAARYVAIVLLVLLLVGQLARVAL